MAALRITDQQLIAIWEKTRPSTTECASAAGLSIRRCIARLRKLGIPPQPGKRGMMPHTGLEKHIRKSGRLHKNIDAGTVIVFSDAHYFPGIESTAHRALLKLTRELHPKAVIANGDMFDGSTISRFPRIGWDSKPKVKDELEAVTARMTEVEDAAPRGCALVWPLGNHDARFETFLAANTPQYEGVPGFHLKDHFSAWTPCWAIWINNDTVVKHRMRGGIHATRNNTLSAGRTIVTGHLHSLKVTPLSDYNGTRWGVDTGTLAAPYGPQFEDYTEDGAVDWRSGFAVLTYWKGRLLWPETVHVMDEDAGLVEFRGKVLKV